MFKKKKKESKSQKKTSDDLIWVTVLPLDQGMAVCLDCYTHQVYIQWRWEYNSTEQNWDTNDRIGIGCWTVENHSVHTMQGTMLIKKAASGDLLGPEGTEDLTSVLRGLGSAHGSYPKKMHLTPCIPFQDWIWNSNQTLFGWKRYDFTGLFQRAHQRSSL